MDLAPILVLLLAESYARSRWLTERPGYFFCTGGTGIAVRAERAASLRGQRKERAYETS